MHACAMATGLEFGSGASVLLAVGMQDYRIIMSRLEVDYLDKPEETAWSASNGTHRKSRDCPVCSKERASPVWH